MQPAGAFDASVANNQWLEKKTAPFFENLNLKSGSKDLELKEFTKGTGNVGKGANAAYVGKISHVPTEAELLLNSGQEMVIKSVSVDNIGKLHVILDLII